MKFLLFLFLPFCIFSSEDVTLSRLQALSVLKDDQLAMQEANLALKLYPKSKPIHIAAIKTFASAGAEELMMEVFQNYGKLNPEDPLPRDALEEMAWGVIEKGSKGSSPIIRAIALIAATMGNDARGVDILVKNCADSHRLIRSLVVEFISHFKDEALIEVVKERIALEKDVSVRIKLVEAIGAMQIHELEDRLLAILENDRALAEEKVAAISSILQLKETVPLSEIQKLVKSPRAGLRALGAELIQIRENKEDAELLLPLLKDSHSEVRKLALESIGSLRIQEVNGISVFSILAPLHQDSIPEVAMMAAWVLMLNDPKAGQEKMRPWINSRHADERLFAAAALKGAGKYGNPLILEAFKTTEDWHVKLTLALALLEQNKEKMLATQAIFDALMQHKEKIMECSFSRFQAIGPCKVSARADIPNYSEAVNQMTRLELLNRLAIQEHPQAMEAVLQFLQERPWGVTGAASTLLLTEGDEEALILIRKLLKNPSEKVQLQAALILAMWGNDSEASATLQRLYFTESASKKEQIIEALGRIGDFSAMPFLVDRLNESHQTLRMIAAASILATLYH